MGNFKLWLVAAALAVGVVANAALVDATIMVERAANNKTLTVRYDNAAASTLELRINGVSVAARQLDDTRDNGEVEFSVDVAALEDGENRFEIRLYDKAGKLLGTQRSSVTIDRSGNGPVFLTSPKPNAQVQGFVEISVGFRTQLRNLYVSFFVNEDFKAIKNFAPFSFTWDTTSVPNGWHEVQAWVVDESNATFKTERMRLFVNNPGGRTKRSETDGVAPANTKPAPVQAPARPAQAKPTQAAPARPAQAAPARPANVAPARPAQVRPATVAPAARPAAKPQTLPLPRVNNTVAPATKPATKPTGNTSGQASGAQLSAPVKPGTTAPAVNPGTVEIRVKPPVSAPARPAAQPVKPATKPVVIEAGKDDDVVAAAPRRTISFGTRMSDVETFEIYVEGARVNFDVDPFVMDGVPMTPFRHLFEHSGGKVKWDHNTKTVDATGNGMTVWFRIGNPDAKVNGNTVAMEIAPFVRRNRSVVPLSFVSEALGVKVEYDASTGHVLIMNNRKN